MIIKKIPLTLRKHLRCHRKYKRVFSTISIKMRNVKFMIISEIVVPDMFLWEEVIKFVVWILVTLSNKFLHKKLWCSSIG